MDLKVEVIGGSVEKMKEQHVDMLHSKEILNVFVIPLTNVGVLL